MRVLHVISDTDRRGPQRFATDLSAAMTGLGHRSDVVALSPGEQKPGLGVDVLGTGGRGPVLSWGLRGKMRQYDITVSHGPEAGEVCANSSGRSTPFVYRQVRDTRFWRRRPPRPKKTPVYFRKASSVFALSPGARSDLLDLLSLPGARVKVAPTGIPTEGFRVPAGDERAIARSKAGIEGHEFVAITMGSLVMEKGIDVAIRAAIELDGVRLIVVGDGPERDRLERLAEGLAPGRVDFAGAAANPFPVYAAADVLIHPSTSGDSMPVVLMEAGLCGLPAITTPIGSIEQVVVHGVTGLVVPVDDVDGLRGAIEVMRVGRVGRELMGEAARERCVSQFEIDVVAKEWIDLLGEVVAVAGS